MSAGNCTTAGPVERYEDFPVRSLQHLEGKVGSLRRLIMTVAAQLASEAAPEQSIYHVEPSHIDRAMQQLFPESHR